MKTEQEIKKARDEMAIRRRAYFLDMCQSHVPGSVVYNTDIIRKLEVTDCAIDVLNWVLESDGKIDKKRKRK